MKNLLILLFTTLIMSCGTNKSSNSMANQAIQSQWELNMLDGKEVNNEKPIFINLTSDNKVNGFIGCNQLNGSYTIENNTQIKFENLGLTRMMCSEDKMELESEVLEVLKTSNNFTIVDNQLMLNIGKRAHLATFSKMSDNAIVNKYWKVIEIDGKSVEMADSQEKEQFFMLKSNGSFHGFAGCNNFNGEYELKGNNEINFLPNTAVTMMACPDIYINEQLFLNVFHNAESYTINGDDLTIKSNEHTAKFEAVYF